METENKGWVVINECHKTTGSKMIIESTFSYSRKGAVSDFIKGSGHDWEYWKRNYNYKVVKATRKITTLNTTK